MPFDFIGIFQGGGGQIDQGQDCQRYHQNHEKQKKNVYENVAGPWFELATSTVVRTAKGFCCPQKTVSCKYSEQDRTSQNNLHCAKVSKYSDLVGKCSRIVLDIP